MKPINSLCVTWFRYWLLGIILVPVSTLLAQGVWNTGPSLPSPRVYGTAAEYDGKIYFFGGCKIPPDSSESTVYMLDPATGSWSEKGQMPVNLAGMVSVKLDDKIYIVGGGPTVFGLPGGKLFAYYPLSDTWEEKAEMITPRSFCAVGVQDGKIITVGGSIGSSSSNTVPVNDVEVYDPLTNTWSTRNPFPKVVVDATAAKILGLYVMGGTDYSPYYGMSENYFYDANNDMWLETTPMNYQRWGSPAVVLNGNIYLIGGNNVLGNNYVENEYFSPYWELWFNGDPMPTKRRSHAAAAVDGKIYIMGGVDNFVLDNVEIYTPEITAVSNMANEKGYLTLFPNPASGQVMLSYSVVSRELVEIDLYDAMYRPLRQIVCQLLQPGEYSVLQDFAALTNGTYLMIMKRNGVPVSFEKIIVLH